jgi:hypothetical protein
MNKVIHPASHIKSEAIFISSGTECVPHFFQQRRREQTTELPDHRDIALVGEVVEDRNLRKRI